MTNLAQETLLAFVLDDEAAVKFANEQRQSISQKPSQSNFRVFAMILLEMLGNKELRSIFGTNCEPDYIGGSICAERAAICQLRMLTNFRVIKIIIVTDNCSPIAPGPLCREFMMSQFDGDTPVVMGNKDSSIVVSSPLASLWPCRYLYCKLRRENILTFAVDIAAKIDSSQINNEFHKTVLEAASKSNIKDTSKIHPIALSAAIIFSDLSVDTAWFLKCLEYGCSLDPVSQLVFSLENRRDKMNVDPIAIAMVDQFGIAHCPFAQARALLFEFGYNHIDVLYHDCHGSLHIAKVHELLPNPNGDAKVLKPSDFQCC